MICKEIEEEIYLYHELTASHKEIVDEHIKHCTACQKLFVFTQEYQSIIIGLAENKPQPSNHARLTSNIMQGIGKRRAQTSLWLNSLFIKYSMVVASLILVVAFGFEQSSLRIEQLSPVGSIYKRVPIAKTITLNSASVAEVLQNQKEKRNVSFYVCLKTGACTHTLIENFKQKKF